MRKLLIGLVLSLVATVTLAQPQWVLVVTATDGDKTYADPSTKKRTGNVVRIWELRDSKNPVVVGGKALYSDRGYFQYDCSEGTRQYLQSAGFSGQMGTGELVGSDNRPSEKLFVAPGSVSEVLLNHACK
jgi:hypothetical protein